MRESEHKFRQITNNLPGLVFQLQVPYRGPHHFSYVSPRGLELFDLNFDIRTLDCQLISMLHPEDQAAFYSSIDRAMSTGANWQYEGRLLNSQGKIIWIQGIAAHITTDHDDL
ncbi:MAG: PAS domain-containing protein [Caldilineaceae bacterium]